MIGLSPFLIRIQGGENTDLRQFSTDALVMMMMDLFLCELDMFCLQL